MRELREGNKLNNIVLWSIVIPHFNTPKELCRLIESIPNRSDIEVLVIDDNSTELIDEYRRCKEKYKDRNIVFLQNNIDDKGAGASRNIGIDNAHGKWILFADSDDFFTEDLLRVLERDVDSDFDVIFYYPTSIDENGNEGTRHVSFCDLLSKYYRNPSCKNELVVRYQIVSPWSKLIRRELVVNNNIRFENTKVANDMMFCRKLGVYAKNVSVSTDVIYVVTDRIGSLVKQKNAETLDIRREVYVNCCNYVREHVDKKTYRAIGYKGGQFTHLCREYKLGAGKYIETCWYFVRHGMLPVG